MDFYEKLCIKLRNFENKNQLEKYLRHYFNQKPLNSPYLGIGKFDEGFYYFVHYIPFLKRHNKTLN